MKKQEAIKDQPMTDPWPIRRWAPWLVLILAVAAFFRLYDLGMSAFRGDTIILWNLAQQRVPPAQLFSRWFEVSGAAGQMPLPAWIAQVYVRMTGWQVTPFNVRFPPALLGILAVAAAFFGGRRFKDARLGLMLAGLLAVNAFHIALCREAYFYSALILGYFLFFWAFADLSRLLMAGDRVGWRSWLLLAAALFMTAYSQITGLLVCGAGGLLFVVLLLVRGRKRPGFAPNLAGLIVTYLVILLPMALAAWGLRPLLDQIGQNREAAQQVTDLSGETLIGGFLKALAQFSWGSAWPGLVILAAALIGGIAVVVRRRDINGAWVGYIVVMQLALFYLSRSAAGASYEARYMAGMFPFFLALLAYGLLDAPGLLARNAARAGSIAFCGLAFLYALYPAWLQTRLTGKPTPYYEIVRFADANLPPGAPVVVDRWYEPWNELAAHPGTNAQFVFITPNEPLEVFRQFNWRDAARAALEAFPDAAYLEIAKTYWDVPGIGPWTWPRDFFARQVTFANKAGLRLRELGLANRGDFYAANTSRTVVALFYNTEEDAVERARRAGRETTVWYGPGWGFEQTGPMPMLRVRTPTFRAFKSLAREAAVDVWNLSDRPLEGRLDIKGVAVGGAKVVQASRGGRRTFPAGRETTVDFGPLTLAPGLNTVKLADPHASAGNGPLLLVERIAFVPAGAAP